jgi:anti-sigma factor RsiW
MKCVDVRQFILMADVADLAAPSEELRSHLAGCAECAAAAGRVVSATALLRDALTARRAAAAPVRRSRSRSRRVLYTQIPLVLAAGIALVAFFNQRDGAVIASVATRIGDDTTVVPTVAELQPVAVPVAPRHVRHSGASRPSVENAHRDSSSAHGDSAQANEDSAWYSPVTNALQVIPVDRHQRVAVIGTSNPKITVVWLTKGDSL